MAWPGSEGPGSGQGTKLRRSGDRSARRPQADLGFEKVVPEGAVLGHQVHLCPRDPPGGPGPFTEANALDSDLISHEEGGQEASLPQPLGAEEGQCAGQLKGPGEGPGGTHFDPGLGGAQGLAELSPQMALLGGLRHCMAWQGQAGLCAQHLSHP